MKTSFPLLAFAGALTSSLPLSAQFITPVWEGSPNSEQAAWDIFTSASVTPNSPDVTADSPTNDATITCSTSSAFLTSGSNIYSFSSALSFQLDDSADFPVANVLLQIFSQGSELDLTTLRLIPADATGPEDILPPTQAFLINQGALTGENGGLGSSYAIQWDTSAAPLTGTYSILFQSEESSMSLDKASLHTSDTYTAVSIPVLAVEAPTIQLSGGNIVISWPLDGGDTVTLQQSQNLSDEDSWTAITTAPTETSTRYEVSLTTSPTTTFFRFQQQTSAQ